MAGRPRSFKRLAIELSRLPGIGPKTANRLAYHIVTKPRVQARALLEALDAALGELTECGTCFAISDQAECDICSDEGRDRGMLCVVEDTQDLYVIEDAGVYKGLYHVLGGVISPSEGRGPDDIRITPLRRRVERQPPDEIILALSSDPEGESTIACVVAELASTGIPLRRLAVGMAYGSRVEYVDPVTLGRALEGRRDVD